MRKVLSKDNIIVSRVFISGGSGMITIKDLGADLYINIYPEEARYLAEALTEILKLDSPSNPPPDKF